MNMQASRIVADLGGGTVRIARVHLQPRQRPTIQVINIERLRFSSAQDVIDHFFNSLKELAFDGQNRIVLSIAGPVDTAKGEIIKLTNHTGVDVLNIPLGTELSKRLSEHFGRSIELVLINDGEAGAWAEFGEGGALGHLKPGDLGMALIIGNGVGGRLYTRTVQGDLQQVSGAFEPGHAPVDYSLLSQLGLAALLSDRIECGCGTVGLRRDNPYCFESVANGPAIERMVRQYLGKIAVARYQTSVGQFPDLYLTKQALGDFPLVQAIIARTQLPLSDTMQLLSSAYTNADMTQVMHRIAGDSLAQRFLERIGRLYARRLEDIQRGVDDRGPITFALIGGIGVNWGPGLVPQIEAAISAMHGDPRQVPAWAQQPKVAVGAFPSEETNLIGDAYYLLRSEA